MRRRTPTSGAPLAALIAVVFCFAAAKNSAAQLPTATILGIAKDSSGAVVPDATLTLRNVNTGLTRTTATAADGSYRFPALPVGNYEIRVEHAGFQSEMRTGLTLAVGQEALVNFTLNVGQVQETVSVTAEAPLVNTTSGTLGSLVGEKTVADLPLNGRNFIDLTLLQPGVSQHKNLAVGPSTVGVWFSANGAPLRSNSYLLDGTITTNLTNATAASADGTTLGIEGIREYRVITSGVSAEYGMAMGGQVVLVSKNGTNDLHGSLFEYLRNSALDARNFFDYKTVATKRRLPAFTRNQFGGSFGGPIRKDKTFFFGSYEGLRQRLGVTTVDTVIPAACHTATNNPCTIPAGQNVPPVIQPLLALFPAPNLPSNLFTYPFTQPTTDNYGQFRVDESLSSNDTFFVRYTINDATETNPLSYPQFSQDRVTRNQFVTLSENHIFSAALLNSARYSFSRTRTNVVSPSGIIGPQYSFVPGREIGLINIGGINGIGPAANAPAPTTQNLFAASDDLVYTHGAHALKFGALFNHYQQYMQNSTSLLGTVSFASPSTFLTGQPTTYTATTVGSIQDRTYHYNTLGFYGQDDWRVFPRFTLNIGLRYEFLTVPVEMKGHGSAVRDIQHDAAGTLGAPFRNMSLRNFSPRFGFAWDVTGSGKMAVRGSFAELFDLGNFGQIQVIGSAGTPPFSSSSTVQNPASLTIPFLFRPQDVGRALNTTDYLLGQPHILEYNLTIERQFPSQVAVSLAYAGSRGLDLFRTPEGNPTVPLGIPNGQSCVLRAVGQPVVLNGPKCWLGNDPRTNPNWSTVSFHNSGGDSYYNSLQLGLTKRLSHGLQFQSSYTWSKLIDDAQGQASNEHSASSGTGTDPSNPRVDRGLADFDVEHNWRFNAIYQIPSLSGSPGLLGGIAKGWRVSGILSLQTGYPFTPALGSNASRSGVGAGGAGSGAGIDRPNLVSGRNNGNIVRGGPIRYFEVSAFTLQPAGFLGTAARNMLRAPGLSNLDFSLVKDTSIKRLGESGHLEFRAELFNILNKANFGVPNRTVFSGTGPAAALPLPSAGVITNTITPSRQIQFALKLLF